MGKYGDAAVRATDLVRLRKYESPVDAWHAAVNQEFPNSRSSREKGCPRGSYLGLCEDGYVIGVKSGNYTRSKDNKSYTVASLRSLKREPNLKFNKSKLWQRATKGKAIAQNGQLDVALSLSDKGYIDREKL